MSHWTVWFIRMSLIYFFLATLLGLLMLLWPGQGWIYLPSHTHLNLLGWMCMMIYGVGYHILPRFSGKPIFSETLIVVQFWLANLGLVGMSVFWGLYRLNAAGLFQGMLLLSAIAETLAIFLFVYNILRTVKPAG